MSKLFQYLSHKQFCIVVEYLTSHKFDYVNQDIAGFPTLIALADRVHSDDDPSPLQMAQHCPSDSEKLIHFSGKARDIADYEHFLHQAKTQGISNLLLLTGDKLKHHHFGTHHTQRTRYFESVNAVMTAKQKGGFCIGVAFNPFKYAEAERNAQYFKLHKKIQAGADFIITQLGYDLDALKQAQLFLKEHDYQQRIMACIMPLSLARAKYIVKHQVAGIVITQHMLNVLEQEKHRNLTDRVYLRCALQLLICQHLGFAGVHLSACNQPEQQLKLTQYIEKFSHLSLAECEALWSDLWQIKTGKEFHPEMHKDSLSVTSRQRLKYRHLNFMHDVLFQSKVARGMGYFIFKSQFWNHSLCSKLLLKTELISKHSVVGCESCGQCRLADTLYICPETCPKGLANGPCGGTHLDRCEFGDRECIHSVKASLAKAVNQTEILKHKLIPTVPSAVRGTSSWKNWYLAKEA